MADVISANLHALKEGLMGIYHVGTGIETSVNHILKILSNTFPSGSIIEPIYKPSLGELQRTALASSKLRQT